MSLTNSWISVLFELAPGNCADDVPSCQDYVDECTGNHFVRKSCRKSCGICGKLYYAYNFGCVLWLWEINSNSEDLEKSSVWLFETNLLLNSLFSLFFISRWSQRRWVIDPILWENRGRNAETSRAICTC